AWPTSILCLFPLAHGKMLLVSAHPATPRTSSVRRDAAMHVAPLHATLDLVQIIQRLSLARDLAAVQQIVKTSARRFAAADGATFVLREGAFCHYADEDAIAPLWKGKRFPLEACISGWSMIHRQPAVIPDIYVDPRIPQDAYRPTFVKSLVMVP